MVAVINMQDTMPLGTMDRKGLAGKSTMLRKNVQAFGHQTFLCVRNGISGCQS